MLFPGGLGDICRAEPERLKDVFDLPGTAALPMGQDRIVRILSPTQSEEEATDKTPGGIAEWSANEAARAA